MAPKKSVDRELFDQIVENIRDAHEATNLLFKEKIGNVLAAVARIESNQAQVKADLETNVTKLENKDKAIDDRQNRVERRVYWLMGVFAALQIAIAILSAVHKG